MNNLSVVNAYLTSTLLALDSLQYGLLNEVYQYRIRSYPSQGLFADADKGNMWECREVMFNRWSERHWDRQDPHLAWAAIVYTGTFTGAYFQFPELSLRLKLSPGDVVFFRGRDLLHEVPPWESGERHFAVHFTHEALWNEAGIVCE